MRTQTKFKIAGAVLAGVGGALFALSHQVGSVVVAYVAGSVMANGVWIGSYLGGGE